MAAVSRWVVVIALVGLVAEAWAEEIDFAHDVVPILKQHCVPCHGGEESKGGFSINTRSLVLDADVVQLGDADASRLIQLVASQDVDERMPPKGRQPLADAQIQILKKWIQADLSWEPGWTFADARYEPPLHPRRPELPPPVAGRNEHPIDRILAVYYEQQQITPPAQLDDDAFLRRVYLDVIGLLPPPDQRQAFIEDPSPDKRQRLVDQLLANDRQYAEHWLTFWNDLLRNSYAGTGYIDGGRQQITQWLYAALLNNRPYDQFVSELVSPSPESAGFIQGIKWRGEVNASQSREVQFAQSLCQVFLGINMKCASCHDSFIDRWTLDEAYGLAAVYATSPLEIYRCDQPTGRTAAAAWIFPELGQIDPAADQPQRLAQLADLMTHPENGRLTRTMVNRIWHRFMGRGIVHPVDAMNTPPWNADLLDFLAVHLAENKYDLKQTMRLILTSHAYQSQSVIADDEPTADTFVYQGPVAKRLTAEQFLDAVWSITETWPEPDATAWRRDGRQQGGQLADVLAAEQETAADAKPDELKQQWGQRPVRAVFTPLDSLQASLGRPNREQIVTTRPPLVTTLEAITLANGQILAETLQRGSEKLLDGRFLNSEQLVDGLYLAALSRPPTASERSIAVEIVGDKLEPQAVEDLLWVVLMLPEFQFVR